VRVWRCLGAHREAQQDGPNGIFAGHRMRVAGVIRDYGLCERDETPEDSLIAPV
jgi:hypothetical protein